MLCQLFSFGYLCGLKGVIEQFLFFVSFLIIILDLKEVEKIRPSAIIDIIHSGEQLNVKEQVYNVYMTMYREYIMYMYTVQLYAIIRT